jgi:hypothetical protein
MSIRLHPDTADVACAAVTDLLDGGTLEIRTGAAPALASDADSGVLLAVCTFGTPAFAAPVDGVATANAITPDASANATGTALHFRAKDSGGDVVLQGSITGVGGGGDLQLSSTSIVATIPFSVASLTYTHPLA